MTPTDAATTLPSTTASPSAKLPKPASGFLVGHVSSIGDSVVLGYTTDFTRYIPRISIDTKVSLRFSTATAVVRRLRAEHRVWATVVTGYGTNGPISTAKLASMFSDLAGASRIVLVTVRVDRP